MSRRRPERAAERFQGLAAHVNLRNSHAYTEAAEAPVELLPSRGGMVRTLWPTHTTPGR